MLTSLLTKYKNNEISQRQFIISIKNNKDITDEVVSLTSFLDIYNVDILERIYYIINGIKEPVKCRYCDNKAIFTGRINEGYKEICNSKDCRSKQLSDKHTGNTKITDNRDVKFIEWQKSVTDINDDIICENIKIDRCVDLIDNAVRFQSI